MWVLVRQDQGLFCKSGIFGRLANSVFLSIIFTCLLKFIVFMTL